jgi:hypothetical protein
MRTFTRGPGQGGSGGSSGLLVLLRSTCEWPQATTVVASWWSNGGYRLGLRAAEFSVDQLDLQTRKKDCLLRWAWQTFVPKVYAGFTTAK